MSRNPRDSSIYRRKAKAVRESGKPCWLCGKPIDLRLKYPHPMSAASDHYDALAKGGELLGPMGPTHKVCNEKRGAGRPIVDYTQPPTRPRKPLHSRDW